MAREESLSAQKAKAGGLLHPGLWIRGQPRLQNETLSRADKQILKFTISFVTLWWSTHSNRSYQIQFLRRMPLPNFLKLKIYCKHYFAINFWSIHFRFLHFPFFFSVCKVSLYSPGCVRLKASTATLSSFLHF